MEEKLEKFRREIFRYRKPKLVISPEKLSFRLPEGESGECTLQITAEGEERIRGYLVCEDLLISMDTTTFSDTAVSVRVTAGTNGVAPGKPVTGEIVLVTDLGEAHVPYEITTYVPEVETERGKVQDLYAFTLFAGMDEAEGVRVFESSAFRSALLKDQPEQQILYDTLRKNLPGQRAMDEFLIGTGHKEPVYLSSRRDRMDYHLNGKPVQDAVLLKKNTFGYLTAEITAVGDFIALGKTSLTQNDFEGNSCEIPITIDPAKSSEKKEEGEIRIRTPRQELVIPVTVNNIFEEKIVLKTSIGNKLRIERLRAYLEILIREEKTGVKLLGERAAFCEETRHASLALSDELPGISEAEILGLVDLAEGRTDLAADRLKKLAAKEENPEETDEERENYLARSQAYQADIVALRTFLVYEVAGARLSQAEKMGDEEESLACQELRRETLDTLREMSERGEGTFLPTWLLLETDYLFAENSARKLEALAKLYDRGVYSPFVYLKAWELMRRAPELFTQLTGFYENVIWFAIEYDLWDDQLMDQYVYLSEMAREDSQIMFYSLKKIYEKTDSVDALSAIIRVLLAMDRIPEEEHGYFRTGIERRVKRTGIYEAYMDTLPEDGSEAVIPEVYTYFRYDNNLPDRKKAYLYADIIRRKQDADGAKRYDAYLTQMQRFAAKQLMTGMMSRRLLPIYLDLLQDDQYFANVAPEIPRVLFFRELTTDLPLMDKAVILSPVWEEEKRLNLTGGGQFIPFADGDQLLFTDTTGKLFAAADYTLSDELFPVGEYAMRLIQTGVDEPAVLAAAIRARGQKAAADENLAAVYPKLLQTDGLRTGYREYLLNEFITYCNRRYETKPLEIYLDHVDFETAGEDLVRAAGRLILQRDLPGLCERVIRNNGLRNVNMKYTRRLLRHHFEEGTEVSEDFLLAAATYLMHHGRVDRESISYLAEHYEGSVKVLTAIFNFADEREMAGVEFAERILTQMLFSEEIPRDEELEPVLYHIFEKCDDAKHRDLSHAFLAFLAYRYLLFDEKISEEFYERMQAESYRAGGEICTYAVLKYLSEKTELDEDEAEYVSFELDKRVPAGILLPFFWNFAGKCAVPSEILDQVPAFWLGDGSDAVQIHFRRRKEMAQGEPAAEDEVTEWMKEICQGIFVRTFLVFDGECVDYRIEAGNGNWSGDKKGVLHFSDQEREESLFKAYNKAVHSGTAEDEKAFLRQKKLVEKLFSS